MMYTRIGRSLKSIVAGGAVIVAAIMGQSAYSGYALSVQPSGYELASSKLGFHGIYVQNLKVNAKDQQEALLKIFYLAGYFKPENLWNTIIHMKCPNPENLLRSMLQSVIKSNANQDNPSKFNPKKLRKNLFKTSALSQSDMVDFLLYQAQSAFDRGKNQERYQLTTKNWMEVHQIPYRDAATKLGLIVRVLPKHTVYDAAFIAGASRPGILARLVDFNYILPSVTIKGHTTILAGKRPLWAEIDGMDPSIVALLEKAMQGHKDIDQLALLAVIHKEESIAEGKRYMRALAHGHHIGLDKSQPFILYTSADACRAGCLPGRTYPNYIDPDKGILTETMMANDLLLKYMRDKVQIGIIDTDQENGKRPDTATTARDAALQLIQNIQNGDYGTQKVFVLLLQSNQPYVERQTRVTQSAIEQVLPASGLSDIMITVDGVGFANKQRIAVIHSELAALINERYRDAVRKGTLISSRPIKDLQYSTRLKETVTIPMPPIVDVAYKDGLDRFFQDFFDAILE